MNTVTKVLSATAFAGLIGVGAVGGGHAHASELTNQASHTVAQAQNNNQNLQKQPNGVVGEAPQLTVKDQTLKYGQKWNPYKDVTATDKEDGNLTNKVQYDEGYFDGHTPGDYKINYHVEDSTGNTADASSNLHIMTQNQTDQWNAQHPSGEQPDKPAQDDNQKPSQDDNTDNELPHAGHSHDHDGYHDMTPHGDQGQNATGHTQQNIDDGFNHDANGQPIEAPHKQDQPSEDNHGVTSNDYQTPAKNNGKGSIAPITAATTTSDLNHAHGFGQSAGSAETPKTTTTQTTTSENTAHDTKAEHNAKGLPETGEENQENKGLLVSIASILGLSGLATLFVNRKRKTNE